MKKKHQFLNDLYRRRVFNLPFIELFQDNIELRKVLFKQYLKTDQKPDFTLYLNSYYTEQEIEKGLIEANKRIPISNMGMADFIPQTGFEVEYQRISKEFYSLSAKMKIPEQFCKHSIKETSLMIELEIVDTTIRDFNLYVTKKKKYDAKEYAEAWAKNLIHKLESINNRLLTELILRNSIQNGKVNENRFDLLFDHKIEANSAKTKYRELSLYANNVINDYLKSLPPLPGQRIKALFKFIDYLHSNIENFNQYNDLIKELEFLDKQRNKLNPENNYKDKLQYEKVQAEIESKFKILQDNTENLIKNKAKELNLCNFENEPNFSWYGLQSDIHQLKNNFKDDDLPKILEHKRLYLEYRSNTHKTFLSLQFFFEDLDEIAKSLFDYFKDTEQNEFEAFEIKAIPVNSIQAAIKGFKQGHTKFSLPDSFLSNLSNIQPPKNDTLPPQPISIEENRTKKKITQLFEVMDNKGYEYAFMTEQDYNTFTDILINFFEYKKYNLPKTSIQLKRGCKTKLAATLGKIHSELSNVDKFSSDTDYFNIVKCLSHYSNLSNDELYKALTRSRKDY